MDAIMAFRRELLAIAISDCAVRYAEAEYADMIKGLTGKGDRKKWGFDREFASGLYRKSADGTVKLHSSREVVEVPGCGTKAAIHCRVSYCEILANLFSTIRQWLPKISITLLINGPSGSNRFADSDINRRNLTTALSLCCDPRHHVGPSASIDEFSYRIRTCGCRGLKIYFPQFEPEDRVGEISYVYGATVVNLNRTAYITIA
ncbi:MAG: hypothetical protein LBB38_04605, partial [Puniceicoccales bacterium]|jgi:hypothetical protein|nr:hypothetical protein [Puniceicoccales bacterium]